jgi:hypothetical protein
MYRQILSILIWDFGVLKCTRCALVGTVKKWLSHYSFPGARHNSFDLVLTRVSQTIILFTNCRNLHRTFLFTFQFFLLRVSVLLTSFLEILIPATIPPQHVTCVYSLSSWVPHVCWTKGECRTWCTVYTKLKLGLILCDTCYRFFSGIAETNKHLWNILDFKLSPCSVRCMFPSG